MKSHKDQAALIVAQAILDTVQEMAADGAPGGILYAAVMRYMSLDGFQRLMDILVESGRLRKEGELYFYQDPPKRAH